MKLTDDPEEMNHIHEDEDGNEELSDDDLPEWAKRSTFLDDRRGLLKLFLVFFLFEAQQMCTLHRSCSCASCAPVACLFETGIGTS